MCRGLARSTLVPRALVSCLNVAATRREYEALEKQMEEVSNEAARLQASAEPAVSAAHMLLTASPLSICDPPPLWPQDLVDELEAKLMERSEPAPAAAVQTVVEVEQYKVRWSACTGCKPSGTCRVGSHAERDTPRSFPCRQSCPSWSRSWLRRAGSGADSRCAAYQGAREPRARVRYCPSVRSLLESHVSGCSCAMVGPCRPPGRAVGDGAAPGGHARGARRRQPRGEAGKGARGLVQRPAAVEGWQPRFLAADKSRERDGDQAQTSFHRRTELASRLLRPHVQAADRARARTPAVEPRVETASMAASQAGSEANFGAGGLGFGGAGGGLMGGALVGRSPMALGLAMRLPNIAACEWGALLGACNCLTQQRLCSAGDTAGACTECVSNKSSPGPPLSFYAVRAHGADMRGVLEELGLPGLAARFEAEDISPGLLPFMDDTAMRELGATTVGARLKLRIAAQAFF